MCFIIHIKKVSEYLTASMKIAALARTFDHMTLKQSRSLMKRYFMLQFTIYYVTDCPLVCRSLNNHKILHERTLRLVYNYFISSFAELLESDNSVTI